MSEGTSTQQHMLKLSYLAIWAYNDNGSLTTCCSINLLTEIARQILVKVMLSQAHLMIYSVSLPQLTLLG